MLPEKFTLELTIPTRLIVREEATEAEIPVLDGYIGVLPGHAPLLGELGIGELSYQAGGRTYFCAAIGGFVEVLADRVIVLADSAERAEEIDVPRAQAARERAQKRLGTPNNPDSNEAQAALERAETRLKVAAKAGAPAIAVHA